MGMCDCDKCWVSPCECGHDYKRLSTERLEYVREAVNKEFASRLPIFLERKGEWPIITRAVLRHDGIHFINHDGTVRDEIDYPTIESLNKAMKLWGYPEFFVVKRAWS